jgi:hypothetical protein
MHSRSEMESKELKASYLRSANLPREVQLLELDSTHILDSQKQLLNKSPKKLVTNSKQHQINSKHLQLTMLSLNSTEHSILWQFH